MVSLESATVPDLSIVVALKCSRTEDPLEGIRAWSHGQTCERGRLEVVVASNGDHPDWERRLPEVLTDFDRHVHPEERLSTAGLLDAGARAARGNWIYLCELHTVPSPDCAAELLAYLDAHDLAGAVAESGSRGEGPMARAEARYYQEVVGAHLNGTEAVVAGRGVAIRADFLAKAGGVPGDYSIFYERVIQANLRELGARLGHAKKAHFVHAEQSSLSGHRADMALFTLGEYRYRSSHDPAFCDRHLGRPQEWAEHLGYRRDIARMRVASLAGVAWRALRRGQIRSLALVGQECLREAARSLVGAWGEAGVARLGTAWAELRFLLAREDEARYPHYLEIKRRHTRTVRLWRAGRDARDGAPSLPTPRRKWSLDRAGEAELVGFHEAERLGEVTFRWTTPSALVRLALEPGDYEACIETAGLRPDLADVPLEIRFNGAAIPSRVEDGTIRFGIGRAGFDPGPEQRLCWAVAPVGRPRGSGETRRLGVPVASIRVVQRP